MAEVRDAASPDDVGRDSDRQDQQDLTRRERLKRQVSSFLFQSTALATTLAGFPFAFYSRAYAQGNCSPSSVATYASSPATAGGKPNSKIPSVTFVCTVPNTGATLTTPQYAYGGAYTFYTSPPHQTRTYFGGAKGKSDTFGTTQGQPGLNIEIHNSANISLSGRQRADVWITPAPGSGQLKNKSDFQYSSLAAFSRGSDAWGTATTSIHMDFNNLVAGGNGGNLTIVSSGTVTNTVQNGAAVYAFSMGGDSYFGPGGAGGAVTITSSKAVSSSAAGIIGLSLGGAAAAGQQKDAKGQAISGAGGPVSITVTGDVVSTGQGPAVLAGSYGGHAVGHKSTFVAQNFERASDGGYGGAGGNVGVTVGSAEAPFAGLISSNAVGGVTLHSSSSDARAVRLTQSTGGAIVARSTGGQGLRTSTDAVVKTYMAGRGGDARVTVFGGPQTRIETHGAASPGIYAMSLGGYTNRYSGLEGQVKTFGGHGGDGGAVTVTLNNRGSITTSGDAAFGVLAHSVGGAQAYSNKGKIYASTGGVVIVTSDFNITTSGRYAHGIVAQSTASVLGSGLYTIDSSKNVVWGTPQAFGPGSNTVNVTNTGAIKTFGMDATGIVAQSIGGAGGLLTSSGSPDLTSLTSNKNTGGGKGQQIGGNAGNTLGADVNVINSGAITTQGGVTLGDTSNDRLTEAAAQTTGGGIGILAQSIGGGGGTNTGVGAFGFVGAGTYNAASKTGADGGSARVHNSGAITTAASEGHGIVAQSIGGGGGNARNKHGLVATVGGAIGVGGKGGAAYAYNAAKLTTSRDYAGGIIVQSIGGGGGNGGRASNWGAFVGVAVGGPGGGGGDGGPATAKTTKASAITTQGIGGHGIMVQSIGGGGGTGGAAKGKIDSLGLGLSLSFGGSGKTGGIGSTAKAEDGGTIHTSGQNAYGLLVQSIGGGGGAGGASAANAFTIGIPLPDDPKQSIALGMALTIGGSGAAGGRAGSASAILDSTGAITTTGTASTGIVVRSIGGGGGAGGDASSSTALTAMSDVLGNWLLPKRFSFKDNTLKIDSSLAIGGHSGAGSNGGTAYAHSLGRITTSGDFADAMLVQSIGGGGGIGGAADADNISLISSAKAGLDVSVGGKGGGGGKGGLSRGGVGNTSVVMTSGHDASGLVVQSIGGGGGKSGAGIGAASGASSVQIGIGLTGGKGNDGGTVYAWNNGKIVTSGDGSMGILAQSIGGGGGQGGSGSSSLSDKTKRKTPWSSQISERVNALLASNDFDNVKAGFDPSFTVNLTARTGSNGGDGGDGGNVFVGFAKTGTSISTGTTTTSGVFSHGIMAQSVGGGGGQASVSAPANSFSLQQPGNELGQWLQDHVKVDLKSMKASLSYALFTTGTSNGGSGKGGDVAVYANSIQTSGFGAQGVVAQSIGGGGGNAQFSGYSVNAITASLGATSTSKTPNATGGKVAVHTQSSTAIKLSGDDANGIIAQSIGGGGGLMGMALGSSAAVNDETLANIVTITLGSTVNAEKGAVDGGAVAVDHSGTISTSGARSAGIVAQSIGGGGGFLSMATNQLARVKFQGNQAKGAGDAVSVSLTGNGSIVTTGDGSAGIIAQSIGGGGGFVGDLTGPLSASYVMRNSARYGYDHGTPVRSSSVSVDIANGASISTRGSYAHGIVAQSLAGGGGIWKDFNKISLVGGSLHRGKDNDTGGSIAINVAGSVTTAADNAWAVWGQVQDKTASVTIQNGGTVSGTAAPSSPGGAVALYGNKGAKLLVTSYGNLGGNVIMRTGDRQRAGELDIMGTGTFTSGAYVDVSKTNLNGGTLNVGGTGHTGTTHFTGDLESTSGDTKFKPLGFFSGAQAQSWSTATASRGAVIADLDVDMAAGTSDRIIVDGNMSGTFGVALKAKSLLPNSTVKFLSVAGVNNADIHVLSNHVFSFTRPTRDASGWTGFSVAKADFVGAAQLLGANRVAAARGVQNAWDALAGGQAQAIPTDGISIGSAFAAFHGSTPSTFGGMVDAIATETAGAVNAAAVEMAMMTAASVLDCPVFTTGVVLQEDTCVWGRGIGGKAWRDGSRDYSGHSMKSGGLQAGGQRALGEGWFVGGSAGVLWSNFDGSGNGEQADATTGLAALSLKKEIGPWLFAAAATAGYSSTESSRAIRLGNYSTQASASPQSAFLAGRLRGSYELTLGKDFYLRPMVDLDLVAINQRSYSERGAGALNLSIQGATQTFFGITPAVEFGKRLNLADGVPGRLFVNLGATFMSDDKWDTSARLAGVSNMQAFKNSTPLMGNVARIGAGLDLPQANGVQIKLQYDGAIGSDYQAHGGSVRLDYRF